MANLNELIVNGSARFVGKVYASDGVVGDLEGNATSATKDGSGNNIVNTYATKTELGNKQDKITSSNKLDYSLISGTPTIPTVPSSYAPTNAEKNVIVGVQKNGTDLTVDSNRKVNITVPTQASDIGAMASTVTHLSGDVPTTRKVNNKALSADITLTASDVGARASSWTPTKSDIGLGNVGNFKAVSTVASQGLTDTEKSNARANIGAGTSSFSGNYNDLTNKPTIPTVNNATLTIQKNGVNVETFTSNSSANKTANIIVPTSLNELSSDDQHRTVTDIQISNWNESSTVNTLTETLHSGSNTVRITSDVIGANSKIDVYAKNRNLNYTNISVDGNDASINGGISLRSVNPNPFTWTYTTSNIGIHNGVPITGILNNQQTRSTLSYDYNTQKIYNFLKNPRVGDIISDAISVSDGYGSGFFSLYYEGQDGNNYRFGGIKLNNNGYILDSFIVTSITPPSSTLTIKFPIQEEDVPIQVVVK